MDVYVVQLDDVVIGAGSSLDDAQEIADRRWEHEGYDRLAGDRRWLHDPETKSWSRMLAGHAQVIVRVPLAGYREVAFPLGPDTQRLMERDRAQYADQERMSGLLSDLAARRVHQRREQIEQLTRLNEFASKAEALNELVVYSMPELKTAPILTGLEPWPDPAPAVTFDRMRQLIKEFRPVPFERGPIRAGAGEAMNYIRRALDQAPKYPSGKALPDSVAARVWGIDIVLDPNLPPNMIRFGTKIWIVEDDTMMVTDLSEWPMVRWATDSSGLA